MSRKAEVYNNHVLAGTLEKTVEYLFRYDSVYFNDPAQPAISLSFPKTQQEYTSKALFPFFSDCYQRE